MAKKRKDDVEWDELEESIFELLRGAFRRQECAARAAARLERLVVDRYMEERGEAMTTLEEEGEGDEGRDHASREFSADQFLGMFTNINMLRLVRETLHALNLSDVEDEIMSVMVQDSFRNRPSGNPVGRSSGGEGEVFIGDDRELVLHELRKAAARAQRR